MWARAVSRTVQERAGWSLLAFLREHAARTSVGAGEGESGAEVRAGLGLSVQSQ